MGVQLLDTDFSGPLPGNTLGLLIGRSSSTLKGLLVGVLDSDFTGIVKIMVSASKGVVAISPGDRVAQLLLLPSCHGLFPAKSDSRGDKGFGSTGVDSAFLSLELYQRPLLELIVEGKKVLGLLDTGADKSIIAQKD